MDILAAGDHAAARTAAERSLSTGGAADDARRVAEQALAATDADPWAVRTFVLTGVFLAALGWLALVPHPSVGAARAFVEAVAHSEEATAQALFTDAAWKAAGQQLYSGFAGQHGRAYSRSRRGEELGFVLVSFASPANRRYLTFDPDSGLIKAVASTRPRKPKPPGPGPGPGPGQ